MEKPRAPLHIMAKVAPVVLAFLLSSGEVRAQTKGRVDRVLEEVSFPDLSQIPHHEFVRMLEEIFGVGLLNTENVRLSKNPRAPIIILLPDMHGSPEVEDEKLERLYTMLGVNFVGLEGWPGQKAYRKSKYPIINAEKDLIEKKKKDPRFHIVGLESPRLQVKAYRHMITYSLLQYMRQQFRVHDVENELRSIMDNLIAIEGGKKMIEDRLRNMEDSLRVVEQSHRNLGEMLKSLTTAQKLMIAVSGELKSSYEKAQRSYEAVAKIYKEMRDTYESVLDSYAQANAAYDEVRMSHESLQDEMEMAEADIRGLCRHFGSSLLDCVHDAVDETMNMDVSDLQRVRESDEEYERRLDFMSSVLEEKEDGMILNERNEFAVSRMRKTMKRHGVRVGVMVFGKAHIPGIVDLLGNEGDFTTVVLE